MSSQCSCTQIIVGLSLRRRGIFTSPRWKLRMQEITLALFPVPSSGRASSPSSSPSSHHHPKMVSDCDDVYFLIICLISDIQNFQYNELFLHQVRRENTQQTSGSSSQTRLPCLLLILHWSALLWESKFSFISALGSPSSYGLLFH